MCVPTRHFALSQLTLHSSLWGFSTNTHGVLKLPGLLDDEGPGRVGLLHRRANLAVPHAHGRLREVVAQLQTHKGKGIISLRIRFPESLHLMRFTQRDIKASHKVTFLPRGRHLLTLSIVPVRRIPTCCILLVAPRVRLQASKRDFIKWKRKYVLTRLCQLQESVILY